jgi:hypothetical protein
MAFGWVVLRTGTLRGLEVNRVRRKQRWAERTPGAGRAIYADRPSTVRRATGRAVGSLPAEVLEVAWDAELVNELSPSRARAWLVCAAYRAQGPRASASIDRWA